MQFINALLGFLLLFSLSFITATPLDSSSHLKRQAADINVVWVTVTSAYTITVSTVSQVTTTVTVQAGIPLPVSIEDPPLPTANPGPVKPPVQVPPPSSAPAPAPAPPTATPVSNPGNTNGAPPDSTTYSGQGTFFSPG